MAIITAPRSAVRLTIPPGSEYAWCDWGVTTAERVARQPGTTLLRYRDGQPQPGPHDVWGRDLPLIVPESLTLPTQTMLDAVLNRWYTGAVGRAAADAHLALWLTTVLDHLNPVTQQSAWLQQQPPSRGQQLAQLARENLAVIGSVQKWADFSGLGRHQLNRILQQDCHGSATVVLNLLRIDLARDLITGPDPLPVIANQLGFPNLLAFSRWFKRHFTVTPSHYRTSIRRQS